MNFLTKIKFILRKPKVIIVTGEGRSCAREAIYQVLKQHFRIGKDILIFETDLSLSNFRHFEYLLRKSSLPILVVTHIGDIPFERDFFAGEKEKTVEIRKIAKLLPARGYLILNFDDETVREINEETNLKTFCFGFQERADFRASDPSLFSEGAGLGTNFKINYRGNIVPVWLKNLFGKEQIYSALAAASCGAIFDLNLVEISQSLKNYQSLPGKMRLIKGIKNSWILDNSESAGVISMIEAIDILEKLQGFKRKIAALGDILGIGKYSVEAHEAVGEKAARAADLLFTFGSRAKFIAERASAKGMASEKIFQFNTINEGKITLQNEIKEGDLILVDGSKEIEMEKIVEEIKKM